MLKSNRVVISVPAYELRDVDLPGSLFAAEKLLQMPISESLKCANQLISALCKETVCLVRPEIFGHGQARHWMDDRLGAVRNHIGLSDGTSVKVIEGLENHVFFYDLGRNRGRAGLQNLLTWAPEILSHIRSQINTFHGVLLEGRLIQPPTVLSLPKSRAEGAPAELYEYLLIPQCPEETALSIVEKGALPTPAPNQFKELIYIPISESGTCNAVFSRLVAETIAAAYFNPKQCLLLRLPAVNDSIPDLQRQIIVTLEAIRASGIVMPRVAANNIFLVPSDLPESFFDSHDRLSFIFDDTFEFWRYTQALYRKLRTVWYLPGGDRHSLQGAVRGLTGLMGRPPRSRSGSLPAAPTLLIWNQNAAAKVRKK